MIKDLFRKQEFFSIRKISIGVASVMIGASMLSGVQPLGKMEVQAKDKIEVEATQDVQIKVVEHEGGALLEITATKDISNVDIKITLDGQKVTTYYIDKLKAGKSITKELTKAQLDKVKEALAKKIKTLPNTAVVRKNVEKILNIDNSRLKVVVSYDVEEGTVVPNKPQEPSNPGKPETKPEEPSNPGKPDTKPGDSSKPGKPDTKPEGPSNQALRTKLEELTKRELRTEAGYIANQGNQISNNAWISAKTEAERVLKNDSATKEELEAAIKNLEEKIYEAVLGSEKVKVEKFIRAENRLDLIPKLRKAKTLEAVLELKKLVKPEDETTPEGPNKPEEKPGKPEGTPGGTPGTTPEKPGNDENGNKPLPSAKPVINSYSFDDKVVESAGGEVNVTIKGENLTADNVKIKVLNPFTAAKEEELSNSITYKKVGDDVVATIKLPANTTSTAKSFNLVFTDALGMKAKVTYTEERGENGRVITVLPAGKTKQDSVLSFVTISSYQAHHSTDLTTTTTDKGNVSKKTVAHLYGANLKANITKVKIIDQNGVEWPIHTTGSNIEASDYPMMVIGKLGNGISGNGTYQEAEIVLPNNLDTDMTFTYVFAPDGVNFDEAHKVTAVVEKTTNVRPAVKRTITVKYQDENGKTLKDDKVLTGYSWFNYSIEKDTIDGYKNVIVKDNKALSGKFGTKDQEIVLVYTNKEVAQPSEIEKPVPQEDTLATSKAKLKELADRDLKLEDSYKKASSELQTNWRRARALANRVLAESNNKEEVDNQL